MCVPRTHRCTVYILIRRVSTTVTSSVTYCEPPETLLIQQFDIAYIAANSSVSFNISAASVVRGYFLFLSCLASNMLLATKRQCLCQHSRQHLWHTTRQLHPRPLLRLQWRPLPSTHVQFHWCRFHRPSLVHQREQAHPRHRLPGS